MQFDERTPGQPADTSQPGGGSVISFEDRLRSRREASDAPAATTDAALARARVAAVNDTCWCCRQKVRAIVGVLVDPALTPDRSGFLALESIDSALTALLDQSSLSRRGIAGLRHRESPGVEGGYIANGCPECDALIGRFQIEDLLNEHRNAGGSNAQLDTGVTVQLPLAPAVTRTARRAIS